MAARRHSSRTLVSPLEGEYLGGPANIHQPGTGQLEVASGYLAAIRQCRTRWFKSVVSPVEVAAGSAEPTGCEMRLSRHISPRSGGGSVRSPGCRRGRGRGSGWCRRPGRGRGGRLRLGPRTHPRCGPAGVGWSGCRGGPGARGGRVNGPIMLRTRVRHRRHQDSSTKGTPASIPLRHEPNPGLPSPPPTCRA
jgi:hypothetical protein